MLVKHIMTKNVITVSSNTSVGDAKKIMKEHKIRRLPVVDDDKLVGIVTEDRLEGVTPKTTAPLLWQITYLISHTTVRDVMRKKVVTVKPATTFEKALALAQRHKVGTLLVVEGRKVVGIVTTNDFFYRIVNSVLGLGESGTRIIVLGAGDGKSAAKIIACINKLHVGIKVIWTTTSIRMPNKNDILLQLDTEDATEVVKEIQKLGFTALVRER